jgi:hypothetical protein
MGGGFGDITLKIISTTNPKVLRTRRNRGQKSMYPRYLV